MDLCSCLGTGKYGGKVTIVYDVTIIGGAGTSETLSSLIYDFSGSSYHYNADFSMTNRIAVITEPDRWSPLPRYFVPSTILPG